MTKPILFVGVALLICASFEPELFAQSNQTVNPVPITPPSLNTTTLTCQINCDTQAMNCMNNCIPIGGLTVNSAGAVSSPVVNPSCNSTCSSQQLVCKQQC
jgi:hypothetical protein